jgi:hypothetical protein
MDRLTISVPDRIRSPSPRTAAAGGNFYLKPAKIPPCCFRRRLKYR